MADDDTLRRLLAEAAALRDALDAASAARASAEEAAAAHRADPGHAESRRAAEAATVDVARLRVLVESQRVRAEALAAELVGVPPTAELEASIAEARRLAAAQQAAVADHAAAEQAHDAAVAARAAIAAELRRATAELQATRDRLAALGSPGVGGDRLAAGWSTLVTWARRHGRRAGRRRDVLAGERGRSAASGRRWRRAERAQCAAVLGRAPTTT